MKQPTLTRKQIIRLYQINNALANKYAKNNNPKQFFYDENRQRRGNDKTTDK
jgi:hypothetical protein